MTPQYLNRLAELSEAITSAMTHQSATSDLTEAAGAAVAGRMSHLDPGSRSRESWSHRRRNGSRHGRPAGRSEGRRHAG
jgi:hypothetical protein